jgi:hypothetical protein
VYGKRYQMLSFFFIRNKQVFHYRISTGNKGVGGSRKQTSRGRENKEFPVKIKLNIFPYF